MSARPAPQPLYERLPPGPCNDPERVAASQLERLCGAMAHGVATQGYEHVRVRGLCALAAVAPNTLYKLFPGGTHECFLGAQEQALLCAGRGIAAAQSNAREPSAQLRLALEELARLVADRPQTAYLVLLEAPHVSPQARERSQRAQSACAQTLAQLLGCSPAHVSPIAPGVVAGVAHVTRKLLLADRANELPQLAGGLARWALNCGERALAAPASAQRRQAPHAPAPAAGHAFAGFNQAPGDERSRLMGAAIELLGADDAQSLCLERLAECALVPKRRVEVLFGGCRQCALAAIGQGFARLLDGVVLSGEDVSERERAQHVLAATLARLAADRALARAAFVRLASLGREGVRLRESLIDSFARTLGPTTPASASAEAALDASAGAVWGAIEHSLGADSDPGAGPDARLPRTADLLCLLASPASHDPRQRRLRDARHATRARPASAPATVPA